MKSMVAVAVACTLLYPAGTSAQVTEGPADWNAVRVLKPRAPIKVMHRDGRAIIGSFVSADADVIVIDRRRGPHETLARTDVGEIRMRPKRSTAGSAGIGLLSGYAAGATVGSIAGCSVPCTRDERAQGIALAGGFGGSVGFWTGLIRGAVTNLRAGKLIYRAPASR